ncbi:hypothetical protein DM860_004133 [Cuscuta australis]|uniref:Uncharacterized protein n=1 Tax=Cuscuta australis TaxID=267555 RepID=A0A328CY28_9ASTE|nr:hypothetical protein DM860_004133 [Cuscuta australis]
MSNVEQPKEEQLHELIEEIISVMTIEKDIVDPTSVVPDEVSVIVSDDCAKKFQGDLSLANLCVLPNDVSPPRAFPLSGMFEGVRGHVLFEGGSGLHFVAFEAPSHFTWLGVLSLPCKNSRTWSKGGQFLLFVVASPIFKHERDPPPDMAWTGSLHTLSPTYILRTRIY